MSKRKLIIGFCVITIIMASLMMWVAFGFEPKEAGTSMPGSRFFPMLTLTLIICFSLGLIAENLFKHIDSDTKKIVWFDSGHSLPPEWSEKAADWFKTHLLK